MGKPRNHIVVPRAPAIQGAAVDSLVRAPPREGCAPLGPPRPSTPTVKGLTGGGCPRRSRTARTRRASVRPPRCSCLRFPLGVILQLRPPGPAARLPGLGRFQLTAPKALPPRSQAAFGVVRPARTEAAAAPAPLPTRGPRPAPPPSPRPGDLFPAERTHPHRPRRPRSSPGTG